MWGNRGDPSLLPKRTPRLRNIIRREPLRPGAIRPTAGGIAGPQQPGGRALGPF